MNVLLIVMFDRVNQLKFKVCLLFAASSLLWRSLNSIMLLFIKQMIILNVYHYLK